MILSGKKDSYFTVKQAKDEDLELFLWPVYFCYCALHNVQKLNFWQYFLSFFPIDFKLSLLTVKLRGWTLTANVNRSANKKNPIWPHCKKMKDNNNDFIFFTTDPGFYVDFLVCWSIQMKFVIKVHAINLCRSSESLKSK